MNTSKLNPYLMFNGNCKEAMEFYKSCFGGTLTMQTYGDGGMPGPEDQKGKIMHAMLDNGWMTLMGGDGGEPMPITMGNNVQVSLSGTDPKLKEMFTALSAGGKVAMPMAVAPWGDEFGMFTDKFGIQWLVNVTPAKK
jgi:PhnB protein